MNQSEDEIVLLKPKEVVAQTLKDLMIRGGVLRKEVLEKPLTSNDELVRLVKNRNGRFHVWIRSIEQEFNRSFSPASKLLAWLRNLKHQQWQYHLSWEERANALPEDIGTHLNFLEDIRGRVLDSYEEAQPDGQTQNSENERRLKELMIESFDKDELKELAFDLHIPYGELDSSKLSVLVIDMINYEKRHKQLPELIERIKVLRPKIEWDI